MSRLPELNTWQTLILHHMGRVTGWLSLERRCWEGTRGVKGGLQAELTRGIHPLARSWLCRSMGSCVCCDGPDARFRDGARRGLWMSTGVCAGPLNRSAIRRAVGSAPPVYRQSRGTTSCRVGNSVAEIGASHIVASNPNVRFGGRATCKSQPYSPSCKAMLQYDRQMPYTGVEPLMLD